MPSSKTIADIKTNLLHSATTSHFYVEIDATKIPREYKLANGVKYDQNKLNLLCAEATLPGSNLATLELTSDHTGVTERHAYRRVYDDRIDLTFYVDVENYLPIRFFETWMKWIASESKAVDKGIGAGLKSAAYNYRFKYRDDYASDGLLITKFEKSNYGQTKGKKALPLTYGFVKAYPISISSMPVSYDSSSLLKCTVSMTYIRYYIGDSADNNSTDSAEVDNNEIKFNAQPLSKEQQAAVNSAYAGKIDFTRDLGIKQGDLTTTGGINLSTASSSGNKIKTAFSGKSLL